MTSDFGLDPEISPAHTTLQVRRVAAARGVPLERIAAELARHGAGRIFGIFGEPRVYMSQLNLDLQQTYPAAGKGH